MVQTSSNIKRCTGRSPALKAPITWPRKNQQDTSTHPEASLWFLEPRLFPIRQNCSSFLRECQAAQPRVTRSHPGHMPSIWSRAPPSDPLGLIQHWCPREKCTDSSSAVSTGSPPFPTPEARQASEFRWDLKRQPRVYITRWWMPKLTVNNSALGHRGNLTQSDS